MRNSLHIELPPDYAQRLLETQIQVNLKRQPRQNNICHLLSLYSLGFQHYESIGGYQHNYFRIKMTEIFKFQEEEYAHSQSIKSQNIFPQQMQSINKQQTNINSDTTQHKNQHIKHIQEMTKRALSCQNINDIILMGEYRAIEINTRMKYEYEIQDKLLHEKIRLRQLKLTQNITGGKEALKYNSTKDSLFSQSKGELMEGITNLFANFIDQNHEYNGELVKMAHFKYNARNCNLQDKNIQIVKASY